MQQHLPFQPHSETSKSAAKSAVSQAETDRQKVLDFLVERGKHGATDEEIFNGTDVGLNSHRARRVELIRGGNVEEAKDVFGCKITRPTSSGRKAQVWRIKPNPEGKSDEQQHKPQNQTCNGSRS